MPAKRRRRYWIEWNSSEDPPIPLRDEFFIAPRYTLHVDHPDERYELALQMSVRPGESASCVALTARQRDGGEPVTTDGLRSVSIARHLRAAEAGDAIPVLVEDETGGLSPISTAAELKRFRAALRADRRATRRRIPDEELAKVADAYRGALAAGYPPARAVAEQLRIPRSSAGRWISKAREAGFLGPAIPRQGGEQR